MPYCLHLLCFASNSAVDFSACSVASEPDDYVPNGLCPVVVLARNETDEEGNSICHPPRPRPDVPDIFLLLVLDCPLYR